MRVKYLAQEQSAVIPSIIYWYHFVHLGGEKHCESKVFLTGEHNAVPKVGLNSSLFDLESRVPTTRARPCLPFQYSKANYSFLLLFDQSSK